MFEILRDSRPLIMGILNVTPDSFSDGGAFFTEKDAVARAEQLVSEGADIIDVGGESTRPGSRRVAGDEQIRRVLPVIRALRQVLPGDFPISVDTTRLVVAKAAVEAGANLINDISAGSDDSQMFGWLGRKGIPVVLMHMKGTPATMQENPFYVNVVEEVIGFLEDRARAAERAGIRKENIIVDPGIGFGKRREDNLKLLAELHRFVAMGFPVMLGTSRKRFMGSICDEPCPAELLGATVATTAFGVERGVRIFRVHDVRPNRQAADVVRAILSAGAAEEKGAKDAGGR